MSTTDRNHTELTGLIDKIGAAGQDETLRMIAQPVGYVWGWQDARGEPKDTHESWQFSRAYGLHVARYQYGTLGHRHTVADCFRAWRTGEGPVAGGTCAAPAGRPGAAKANQPR
jgi:hypothetical protein